MVVIFDEKEDLKVELNYEEYGTIRAAANKIGVPMYAAIHQMFEENLRVMRLFVDADTEVFPELEGV